MRSVIRKLKLRFITTKSMLETNLVDDNSGMLLTEQTWRGHQQHWNHNSWLKPILIELRINKDAQCDPVQLITNTYENPESERMTPLTQMELSQLGRLFKSEWLKILKSLILTQFGFSKWIVFLKEL